jgi:hypothetical protein
LIVWIAVAAEEDAREDGWMDGWKRNKQHTFNKLNSWVFDLDCVLNLV